MNALATSADPGLQPVSNVTRQRSENAAIRVIGVVMVACLTVGFGIALLVNSRSFPIDNVRINGDFRELSPGKLQTVAGEMVKGGFFAVDVAAIKESIEAEPWVEKASVRRVWPDTLLVDVMERLAVARWNDDALVDAEAVIFRPSAPAKEQDLPRITGPGPMRKLLIERLFAVADALTPLALQLESIAVDDRRAWSIKIRHGPVVIMGRDYFDSRLQRLVRYFSGHLSRGKERIKAIDMRYPNGFSVEWKTQNSEFMN